MSFLTELKRRNVVRIATAYAIMGWLFTEISSIVLPTFGAPEWVMKVLMFVLVLGFVPTLVFSWVYELTSEGVKKEKDIHRDNSITHNTGRKLDFITLGALLVVLGVMFLQPYLFGTATDSPATDKMVAEVATAEEISSIAVLPFEDFSEGGTQLHLARGIADTILHMLAQVPDMRVAARTSSFAYQGTNADISTIAGELGVGVVLEGSVQRSGDRMRIIAQLIRASDQTHLWSQTFNRTADDIFAIQDEIAQSVVDALRPNAGSTGGGSANTPSSARTDVAAYEHYLRGKEGYEQGTSESTELALRELQAALLIDPQYVPALVQIGMTYMQLNGVTPRTWAEIEPLAEAALRRAVDLAPDDSTAQSGLGTLIRNSGYDSLSAIPYFERALELNPSDVRALNSMSNLHIRMGEIAEGMAVLARAWELDPNNSGVAANYGENLSLLGRVDEARSIARRLLVTRPGEPVGHQLLVNIEVNRGRLDLAIPHALDQLETNPDSYNEYHQLASLYSLLEDYETALMWYERTPEAVQTSDYVPEWLYVTAAEIHRVEAQVARDLELYQGWDGGQRSYVNALFLSGKVAEGVAATLRFEEAFETQIDALGRALAGVMAARIGEEELASRLLDASRNRNEALRKAGYNILAVHLTDAILALADGDHAEAIAALHRSLDAGDLSLPAFRLHPVWGPLRDEPEFQAFVTSFEEKMAAQRQRLKEQGI